MSTWIFIRAQAYNILPLQPTTSFTPSPNFAAAALSFSRSLQTIMIICWNALERSMSPFSPCVISISLSTEMRKDTCCKFLQNPLRTARLYFLNSFSEKAQNPLERETSRLCSKPLSVSRRSEEHYKKNLWTISASRQAIILLPPGLMYRRIPILVSTTFLLVSSKPKIFRRGAARPLATTLSILSFLLNTGTSVAYTCH